MEYPQHLECSTGEVGHHLKAPRPGLGAGTFLQVGAQTAVRAGDEEGIYSYFVGSTFTVTLILPSSVLKSTVHRRVSFRAGP